MGNKFSSVELIENISIKVPAIKFQASEVRLPSGDKPVIMPDRSVTSSTTVMFLSVVNGASRSTLEEVHAFIQAKRLVFANLDYTFGVAKSGIGKRILTVLEREFSQVVAFFCLGSVGFPQRYPADHFYPLVMHSENDQTQVNFLSKQTVLHSGIHKMWIIPVQPAK